MRVLIVIPAFPLEIAAIKGGVNSALSNLLKGFSGIPIKIRVVSFNREIAKPVIKRYSDDISIHYMPEGKLPHVVNFLFNGSVILKQHIKEFEPSILHYAMSGYILLSKFFKGNAGIKQIVTIHGVPFAEAKTKINLKEKLVYYTNGIVETLFCPKNIIHISAYSAGQYKNKNKTTTIIPNAVDPVYFTLPVKFGTNNKLIYIGSIEARKNLIHILKAVKVLMDKNIFFTLSILGGFTDEIYKKEVLRFIENNNLKNVITLHGWTSQQDVQTVLVQSDILVLSSLQETLPMVIAESMSAAKVVVCTAVGGVPEMINNEKDGFLFDSSNVNNIVLILEKLYHNDSLIRQIQLTARNRAALNYHCEIVAKKTLQFYQSLQN